MLGSSFKNDSSFSASLFVTRLFGPFRWKQVWLERLIPHHFACCLNMSITWRIACSGLKMLTFFWNYLFDIWRISSKSCTKFIRRFTCALIYLSACIWIFELRCCRFNVGMRLSMIMMIEARGARISCDNDSALSLIFSTYFLPRLFSRLRYKLRIWAFASRKVKIVFETF